ncbi:anti-sigma-F factor Fin family protein [Alicyclobacillus tolerans]|uniref:anti-sigma-F factor Fin n=1 Tax=Alicyclobacillus tolerans TaxID=90970 RepID=UPI001F2179D8|nr:anti-sigma-F factor Fin [Alicyclobacillus tolerans]MCF8566302.1 anti-sigma-F factor Fin family protein [Alicyclobacillus tolerans]
MRIEYLCRHCHHLVGELNRPNWTTADAERFLGLSSLTQVERAENVAYNNQNNTLFIQTVCDYCQSAAETHPELLVEGKLLQ